MTSVTTAMVTRPCDEMKEIVQAVKMLPLQSACTSSDEGLPPSHSLTWPTVVTLRLTFSRS